MSSLNMAWMMRNGVDDTISTLSSHDVLLGRGASCDRFSGNVKFRALIRHRKAEYSAAPTRDKKMIAHEIVAGIQTVGGRFLRRTEASARNPDIPPTWRIVHHDVAIEKVKQALRDMNSEDAKTPTRVVAIRQVTNGTVAPPPPLLEPNEALIDRDSNSQAASMHDVARAEPPSLVPVETPLPSPTTRAQELAVIRELLAMRTAPLVANTSAPGLLTEPTNAPSSVATEEVLREAHERSAASAFAANTEMPVASLPSLAFAAHPDVPVASLSSSAYAHAHAHAVLHVEREPQVPMSSLLQNAIWQLQEQDWQLAQSALASLPPASSYGATSPFGLSAPVAAAAAHLDTDTVVRVSTSWRDIPDRYWHMLPAVRQPDGPPFASRDLYILLLARALAASEFHTVCLDQIRSVLVHVVRLPRAQLHLDAAQTHDLMHAVHEYMPNSHEGGVLNLGWVPPR